MDRRIGLLNKLVEHVDAQSAYIDGFGKLFNCYPDDDRYDSLINDYINVLAEVIGCGSIDHYLYWYIYDNDCGRSGLEAGVDGEMRKICTVEDFLWLIDLTVKED